MCHFCQEAVADLRDWLQNGPNSWPGPPTHGFEPSKLPHQEVWSTPIWLVLATSTWWMWRRASAESGSRGLGTPALSYKLDISFWTSLPCCKVSNFFFSFLLTWLYYGAKFLLFLLTGDHVEQNQVRPSGPAEGPAEAPHSSPGVKGGMQTSSARPEEPPQPPRSRLNKCALL